MCVERRLVGICWPQNLQSALPGEMWTVAFTTSMSGCRPHVKRERQLRCPRADAQERHTAGGQTLGCTASSV